MKLGDVTKSSADIIWRDANGEIITCVEKVKILSDAIDDLCQAYQSLADDAILMGVCEKNLIANIQEIIPLRPPANGA